MNLARCDFCCDKLDGVNGDKVYKLSDAAYMRMGGNYIHLCEDCMDGLNIDNECLCVNDEAIKIINEVKEYE